MLCGYYSYECGYKIQLFRNTDLQIETLNSKKTSEPHIIS